MPHLNHKGPEGNGSKTGRKLGNCIKNNLEKNEKSILGIGEGKRRHSGGGSGFGKRLKYNQTYIKKEDKL